MTEAEWLNATEPGPMLDFLRGKANDRKLRLFACACCRSVLHIIKDATSLSAVETAERYTDGLTTVEELTQVRSRHSDNILSRSFRYLAWASGWAATFNVTVWEAKQSADCVSNAVYHHDAETRKATNIDWPEGFEETYTPMVAGVQRHQSSCLLDIFGNPFRPSPPLPLAILAWNDRTIPRIAEAIYEERQMPEGTLDTARLGILADALLDAGCEDDELICHCRSEGPHVRGCWAIDLILGRE